jgi:hypothetical protein
MRLRQDNSRSSTVVSPTVSPTAEALCFALVGGPAGRERLGGGGALRQLYHDRVWAESIAWLLEADGYQVIVQVLDFTLVVSGPKGCKQRTFASR